MDNKDIVYLFGARQVQPAPREIFDEEVCDFLGKLSEELRADVRAKQYTDILTFADRYSFALMDAKAVLDSSEQEMSRLAAYFYNDTYLMDQNACSTPHIICWIGEGEQYQKAQKRFWEHIYKEAERYTLEDIKASEKFTMLCSYLMELDTKQTDRYQNLLYVISLNKLPENITKLRGRYGLFFQKEYQNVQDALVHLNDTRVQTCVVYGVDEKEIKKEVIHMHMLGIDRVVPIGKSLDIDLNWDGYDMIRGLSRKIC